MFDVLMLKPEVFGIDISDLSLKIAKIKKKKRSFVLSSLAETPIKSGLISDGEIKDSASLTEVIRRAVKNIQGEKLNTNYVIASLPEEKSFLQIIQLPKMKEEEIRKAIYFEAENYVPLPMDQVYLDFQVVPPLYGHLDHIDALIAALPKKIVDSYLECLKGAGLKPVAFEIESQALSRALVKNEVSPSPLLLIDLGATRTSFIVFSGHSLRFTTSIQVSSQNFTEAIADNLKVSLSDAENLKVKYGLEKKDQPRETTKDVDSKSEVFEALVPSLTDLVEQIKKYLEYYQSHFFHEHFPKENRVVKKILISGGGSNLKGLAEFLSVELKIPVEKADPLVNILLKKQKIPPRGGSENLSFATAIGLALRGAKYEL